MLSDANPGLPCTPDKRIELVAESSLAAFAWELCFPAMAPALASLQQPLREDNGEASCCCCRWKYLTNDTGPDATCMEECW